MIEKKSKWRSRIINLIFFGLVLFFLVSTPAKSWLLGQLVRTGLFSAKIEQVKDSQNAVSAMPLTFRAPNGSSYSTENMKGKVVFINFWASWCPPCRAEMPSVNSLYDQLKNDPKFEFVFINMDDNIQTALEYLKDHSFIIPIHRAEGFIPTDIYNGTLPTTVILDKNGNIVMKHSGMADYDSKNFMRQLKALQLPDTTSQN